MATTSNYPRGLDVDANLLRRVATDTIVPADHNNLVDAIEAIEPTLGIVDDGTAYGAVAHNRGVADHAGFMTTAGPSGRYPWVPRSAQSWYGTDNAVPGGWALDSGFTASFTPPKGPVRFLQANDTTLRYAKVALPAAATYHMVARLRAFGGLSTSTLVEVGLSVDGTETTYSGVRIESDGLYAVNHGNNAGEGDASLLIAGSLPWLGVWVTMDGTDLTVRVSRDMLTWDSYSPQACTDVPGYAVIGAIYSAGGQGEQPALWLDYIAFGSTAPQGQS